MSNPNPYTRGLYQSIMKFMMSFKGKPFTKSAVLAHAINVLEMAASKAEFSVTVVMSPRAIPVDGEWPQGAGNMSAHGEKYFLNLLNRKMVKDEDGKETKEEQRFQIRWRKEFYHPFNRENLDLTQEEITTRNERRAARKAEKKANQTDSEEAKAERREARKAKKEAREAEQATRKANRDARRAAKKLEDEAAIAGVEARKQLRLTFNEVSSEVDEAAEDARITTREFKRLDRLAILEEGKLETATTRLQVAVDALTIAQIELEADDENEKLQAAVDAAQVKVDLWQERTDTATEASVEAREFADVQAVIADQNTATRDALQELADIAYQEYKDAKDAHKAAKEAAAQLKAEEKAAKAEAAILEAEAEEAEAEEATIEIDAETADEDGDRITEAEATEEEAESTEG